MQWTFHCFLVQIDSVGVFLGSGPVLFWCFSAFCFAFSAGETQVWLGDLRVVALVWLLVRCFASIDLLISRTVRPCTDVFTAYSHVRTEPLARHRPNSRKKKVPWLQSVAMPSRMPGTQVKNIHLTKPLCGLILANPQHGPPSICHVDEVDEM